MASKKPTAKTTKKPAKKAVKTVQKVAKEVKTEVAEAADGFPIYNPLNMLKDFLKLEASGGLILLFFAIIAMIVANSPLGHDYHHILHDVKLTVKIGEFGLDKDLIHWINDGLMAIFFFLVGLEIKREMMEGALSSVKQAMLPGIAAVGGMAIPGIIFAWFNMHGADGAVDWSNAKMPGWAVPTATDIAFAVGLMTLLGKKVPLALKVFLLALAIFDDLGAIIIIALFYTSQLDLFNLALGGGFVALLVLFNLCNVNKGTYYLIVGLALWFCVLKSGVHATLAGVVVALTIPLMIKGERRSLLRQLEHDLHPFVAFVVLPVFAFANAGVSLEGISMEVMFETVTLGVILGLFVGKQVGVFGATWLACKTGIAKLPVGVSWAQVWGVSAMAGIGFTMSLFVASLGYRAEPLLLTEAKLGILMGSLMSAVFGLFLLYTFRTKQK